MTYDHKTVEAMGHRELDCAVAMTLFPEALPRVMGWATDSPTLKPIMPLTTTWEGFGLVIERMRELGFGMVADTPAGGKPSAAVRFFRHSDPAAQTDGDKRYYWSEKLPRAAAIAAVLAVEGAKTADN